MVYDVVVSSQLLALAAKDESVTGTNPHHTYTIEHAQPCNPQPFQYSNISRKLNTPPYSDRLPDLYGMRNWRSVSFVLGDSSS